MELTTQQRKELEDFIYEVIKESHLMDGQSPWGAAMDIMEKIDEI